MSGVDPSHSVSTPSVSEQTRCCSTASRKVMYKMTASLRLTSPTQLKSKMSSSSSESPNRCSLQRVASSALQTKSVSVERFGGVVFRTYRLRSTSEFFYVMRCRPSFHVRLLRHEEDGLKTEATVLQVLRGRSDLLVPRLIEYNTSTIPIGSFYLISGPFKGSILADIEPSLSTEALAHIDKSLGKYVRHLARATSPTFGAVKEAAFPGYSSWSKCFGSMLESLLRDAEDALVSLPYEFIRTQARRHKLLLDQITQPKLFILEMISDRDVVVDTHSMTVSGLLDFSTTTWGDPYMSDCFYKPSVSFAEGFGKLPNRTEDQRIRQYL